MSRRVLILGSTGSIGTQTLDVIRTLNQHPNSGFEVVGLAAGSNLELLAQQINEHNVPFCSIESPTRVDELAQRITTSRAPEIFAGESGVLELISACNANLVVNGIVGAAGLPPTLRALELGLDVALANKESLVIGGHLVERALSKSRSKLIPVDSEHNAIFQLVEGRNHQEISKIILTASGGALRDLPLKDVPHAKPEQVLKHPNWSMGQRITVDSATLVNKGFEIIEAKWLFSLDWDALEGVIHPQSVVHGLVELHDGALLAYMGNPDMHMPIQHALCYPDAPAVNYGNLDLTSQHLDFRPIEDTRYPAFSLVVESGKIGGTAPAVVNAADEVAVERFLKNKITFGEISSVIRNVLESHDVVQQPDFETLQEADQWARNVARNW